ncbi:MAG: Holliday junction branch migration protein RuvA [Nitrospirae bacterium CG18_big_fil_WC_8_21_14_2_50_70_55]|nr:MAG: Holliday junction branch migration protein RuvA [Nitrospirae bacterium CG18_big_fil_WC_8_21_14_2_50_70_55]PIW81904.1 MAG: Holliday junction branch migration protein RuvA [Nitrospirae bacterium CG_4_8_14_3_um_filter_70_85]PJB95394.1 MAG: Holliday junction branch migration protein RuvA [Nitrospirae bacterium CG_4_9_14_0_8_um_filter_70_14]HBB40576.1 Holliday junction branch migration protein RuvA [Pseudomonadota bacterium]
MPPAARGRGAPPYPWSGPVIARLHGVLLAKQPEEVVVDCHGVGYRLLCPLSTFLGLPEVGESAALFVHTQVREDAIHLYGFVTEEERHLFRLLLTVQKIGPRLALALLSGLSRAALVSAIRAGDAARLATVPGIGKKTAERLVLELRERVGKGEVEGGPTHDSEQDARSALINLGYRPEVVDRALEKVRDKGGATDLNAWIRDGLALLGR